MIEQYVVLSIISFTLVLQIYNIIVQYNFDIVFFVLLTQFNISV